MIRKIKWLVLMMVFTVLLAHQIFADTNVDLYNGEYAGEGIKVFLMDHSALRKGMLIHLFVNIETQGILAIGTDVNEMKGLLDIYEKFLEWEKLAKSKNISLDKILGTDTPQVIGIGNGDFKCTGRSYANELEFHFKSEGSPPKCSLIIEFPEIHDEKNYFISIKPKPAYLSSSIVLEITNVLSKKNMEKAVSELHQNVKKEREEISVFK